MESTIREPERETHRRSLSWLPWVFGVALLGGVIVAALHFAEAREFARIAERAEPWWLTWAIALQIGTYLAAGQVFRRVARAGGHHLDLGAACRLSLTKLFVDQAVPSAGLSGTVVLASGLAKSGIPRPVAAAGIAVDLASYHVAYVLALAAALVIIAIRGEAKTIILIASLLFFTLALGLSAMVLALSGGRGKIVPSWLARFPPLRTAIDFIAKADPKLARSPRILLQTTGYQLLVVLFDAASVWVLVRSLGADAPPSGVFASFMIASLLRTVGIIPGGLGTFEATSVVTLHMVGVPTGVALAATLLFRGLSFWLPMLPGIWFSRRAMSRGTS